MPSTKPRAAANGLVPHDTEAEEAVIAAALVAPDQIPAIAREVEPVHFWLERARWVFEAILAVHARDGKEGVNQITVARELMARGRLEAIGGVSYLSHVITELPTAIGVIHYAKIVRECYLRRLVIERASEAVRMAHDLSQDAQAVLSQFATIAQDVMREAVPDGPVSVRQVLHEILERPPLPERGVFTGWPTLNYALGPLADSRTIVIAARPSVGKTSLAVNLFRDAIVSGGKRALYSSLEMSRDELGVRLIANEAGVDSSRLENGTLTDGEGRRVSAAQGVLSEALAWIHDSSVSIDQIELQAKAHQLSEGLDLLIVDYLQLIEVRAQTTRYEKITEASRRMKQLAKDLRVPVVLLSQLNRNLETRADRRPGLSDLRESGAIEQDADAVILLHDPREANGRKPDKSAHHEVHLLLAKNRMGVTRDSQPVRLRFYPEFCRFVDVEAPTEGAA